MNQSEYSDNITTQDHWLETTGHSVSKLSPAETYNKYFNRYLPKDTDWTALEIGACPGRHLLALSLSHGYQPVALDYLPDVQRLPEAFCRWGIGNLEVIEADFLTFKTDRKFNIVMSFGFLEHFNSPQEILLRHWDLIAPGGILFVGVPIFGPLQKFLRRVVLTPEKYSWSLASHNLAIMNLEVLRKLCEALPNAAETLVASHVRNMEMWFSPNHPYVRPSRIWILYVWRMLSLVPKFLNLSSRLFSPYAIVIVRKQESYK